MQKQKSQYQVHLFICKGKSCSKKIDAEKAKVFLKEKIKQKNLENSVRACTSTCFNLCDHGPNVMLYPHGKWYSQVSPKDLEEILNQALQNEFSKKESND